MNEEEGASATAGEGAHHLHCTAPGMTYCMCRLGVYMNTVEGLLLSESGGCVM